LSTDLKSVSGILPIEEMSNNNASVEGCDWHDAPDCSDNLKQLGSLNQTSSSKQSSSSNQAGPSNQTGSTNQTSSVKQIVNYLTEGQHAINFSDSTPSCSCFYLLCYWV